MSNEPFIPLLYSFKHDEHEVLPNWLLLDHTVAVVWRMFSIPRCTLGAEVLQRALGFLSQFESGNGKSSRHFMACMNEMRERLESLATTEIHQDDADKVFPNPSKKVSCCSLCGCEGHCKHEDGTDMFPCTEDHVIDPLHYSQQEETATLKEVSEQNNQPAIPKQGVMDFLLQCRCEQLQNLETNLNRLRNLEKFMKVVDDNFQAFTEE